MIKHIQKRVNELVYMLFNVFNNDKFIYNLFITLGLKYKCAVKTKPYTYSYFTLKIMPFPLYKFDFVLSFNYYSFKCALSKFLF